MNEKTLQEKTTVPESESPRPLAEMERLYYEGYSTHEIAERLGLTARIVGRNLREVRKRQYRAADRQRDELAMTQCAELFHEAMQGWRRSKDPKRATTKEKRNGNEVVKEAVRKVFGPGDRAFLQTAMMAVKTVRQVDGKRPPRTRKWSDEETIALVPVLTDEQLRLLDNEQLAKFRKAINACKEYEREFELLREFYEAHRSCAQPATVSPGDEPPAALPTETTEASAEGTLPESQNNL
jgi:hypothetical protein